MITMTTERRRFDARRATVGLLIGALGLTAGAAFRVASDAAARAAAPSPFATAASDAPQVILVRRSGSGSVARTRAS
jgi:hypothetical protein